MKKLLLVSILMMVSGIYADGDDAKKSNQLKNSLSAYRHPKVDKLKERVAPLKVLLANIKKLKLKESDDYFDLQANQDVKNKIVKIIKQLTDKDYQNQKLVDLLLGEINTEFTEKYLATIPLNSKIEILREYLDLLARELAREFDVKDKFSSSGDDVYVLLEDEPDDQGHKLKEKDRKFKQGLESLSALNQVALKQALAEEQDDKKLIFKEVKIDLDNRNKVRKYSQQVKDAKAALEAEKMLLGTVLYDEESQAKLTKKIAVLEKEIKPIWHEVIKDLLDSEILQDNLAFVSFINQNEPPQQILVELLAKLSGSDQSKIISMTLDQQAELLWNLLKQKIIKEMPKLTLLGVENSYESLLDESEVYPQAKGLVFEAALDANYDWNNVAVIEYVMRNFMLGTDSEATYDDIAHINFADKVQFLKNTYLHNLNL